MKLDITLCHSIIKMCLESELKGISRFDRNMENSDEGLRILDEIKKRRITFCLELEEKIEEHFDKHEPELKELYHDFVKAIIPDEENALFLNEYIENPQISQLTAIEYYKILLNVAYLTEDKIIFSEIINTLKAQACCHEINILQKDDILDKDKDTVLNVYRMSRVREFATADRVTCDYVSKWLSRFWKNQNDFVIIDNYVYQHRDKLRKYILDYVPWGSKVTIYTLSQGLMDNDVVNGFREPQFSHWNFEIYLFDRKRENHDRCIITNNFHIQINNLLGAFDNNGPGFISQVTITPNYKTNVEGYNKRPTARKLI